MAFTSGRWQKPSSTSAEALDIFATTYELVQAKMPKKEDKPKCPECGNVPFSRGKVWICSSCGRHWGKHTDGSGVRGVKKADTHNRPVCPICGEYPESDGPLWRCNKCVRKWSKVYRTKGKVQYYKLNIDSIKEFLEWRNRG